MTEKSQSDQTPKPEPAQRRPEEARGGQTPQSNVNSPPRPTGLAVQRLTALGARFLGKQVISQFHHGASTVRESTLLSMEEYLY